MVGARTAHKKKSRQARHCGAPDVICGRPKRITTSVVYSLLETDSARRVQAARFARVVNVVVCSSRNVFSGLGIRRMTVERARTARVSNGNESVAHAISSDQCTRSRVGNWKRKKVPPSVKHVCTNNMGVASVEKCGAI